MVWIIPIPLLSIYCILRVNQRLILHELSKWGLPELQVKYSHQGT